MTMHSSRPGSMPITLAMTQSLRPARSDGFDLAIEAAERVFQARADDPNRLGAATVQEARVAVDHLGELFAALPGAIATALDAARGSAEVLSPLTVYKASPPRSCRMLTT